MWARLYFLVPLLAVTTGALAAAPPSCDGMGGGYAGQGVPYDLTSQDWLDVHNSKRSNETNRFTITDMPCLVAESPYASWTAFRHLIWPLTDLGR